MGRKRRRDQDSDFRVSEMMDTDESCKSCYRKTVDYVQKKVLYSNSGLLSNDFLPLTPRNKQNRGGSIYDFLPSTFGDLPNRGSDPGGSGPGGSSEAFPDRLLLPERVKILAYEIFTELEDTIRENEWDAKATFVACIYIACRKEGDKTRSISEICSVANGVTPANMLMALEFLGDEMKINKRWLMNFKTADLIDWFCAALEMDGFEVEAAQEVAKTPECVNSRRSAYVVAAMVVYVICQFSEKQKRLTDIVKVTGVDEDGILETYELCPHLETIAQECFAIAMGKEKLGLGGGGL